jgi:hypothetical protein
VRAVSIESIGRGTDTNGIVLEMRRLHHGKDCLESRICFKVETVTRTERAFPGKNEISSLLAHTTGVAPIAEKSSIH